MVFDDALIYLIAFVAIWFGAGLIIKSIDHFSRRLRISRFSVSFFILGILTSIPEFAVGLTSISENNPEIFIGNLLGGIPVIFLFIIPILAIAGKEIRIAKNLDKHTLIFAFVVTALPSFFSLDQVFTNLESIIMLILYVLLFFYIERHKGLLDRSNHQLMTLKSYSLLDMLKLLLGVVIVFLSSHVIVDKTVYFSGAFGVSPYIVSLIALSLGTNMPELSLAVRSIFSGKKDIALGDYLGSAAANTLLFGVFSLLNSQSITTANNFLTTFVFITLGMGFFFYYSRSDRNISRMEGISLLSLYLLFVLLELVK
ncbi:sodium:calcium antiporter [Candidatus Gottesmanbacteria bacterium]|nr:sodium:calcium antiporter [Candidatus Gottesmanbacteria bacterium]